MKNIGEEIKSGLRAKITCPYCWNHFAPENVLWVSEHNELLDDLRLGQDYQQRFLPTRFTVNGEALDAKGFPCHQLACPNCHLVVPRPLLEMKPHFLSIFGAPGSGKSYFLASMTWELRKVLGTSFAISFSDADPTLNARLSNYEEHLFVNAHPDTLTPLRELIDKTDWKEGISKNLYQSVQFGTQTVTYALPFLFSMQPQSGHPNYDKADKLSRIVCLFDNAGEAFLPGQDTTSAPVTRHMAHSRALMFVFDPTQDSRFRKLCTADKGSASAPFVARQEPILQEAATRIRRYSGLRQTKKYNRPLIVVLTKCDAWSHLLEEDDPPEPWREVKQGKTTTNRSQMPFHALDTELIERRSQAARRLMLQVCPEIVTAAEGFAEEVIYVPASAVGSQAEVDQASGLLSIRPGETKPYWVTVPYLYALCRTTSGLVPSLSRKS